MTEQQQQELDAALGMLKSLYPKREVWIERNWDHACFGPVAEFSAHIMRDGRGWGGDGPTPALAALDTLRLQILADRDQNP